MAFIADGLCVLDEVMDLIIGKAGVLVAGRATSDELRELDGVMDLVIGKAGGFVSVVVQLDAEGLWVCTVGEADIDDLIL